MSIKAFTLTETLIANTIGTIVGLAMATMMIHMAQASKAIQNYNQFEQESRAALDRFTKDVRQANSVRAYASNAIVLDSPSGPINYSYVSAAKTITRQDANGLTVTVRNCVSCDFKIFQRNPPTAGYDQFIETTDLRQAKLVEVNWRCTSTNANTTINSSVTQSAKVVIRKL